MGLALLHGGSMADFQRLMRNLLYFVVGVLLAAVATVASAENYCAIPDSYDKGPPNRTYTSGGQTVQCPFKRSEAAGITNDCTGTHYPNVRYTPTAGGSACGSTATYGVTFSCPGGGTLTTTEVCLNADPCAEGESRNAETGLCEPDKTPQEQCEEGGGHWGTNHSAGGRFVVQSGCYPNPPSCAESGGILFTESSLDSRCPPPKEGPCPEDIGGLPYLGNLGGGQCLLGGGADPEPEPPPGPEPDQTPSGCASNQQSGTVQGVPVCINKPPPPPTESTDNKTETKPTPDGGTKETTTTTNTTVNNTTNTTTTTTTVTTVIKDAAGNVTGTTTDTSSVVQDSAGYCKENPGAEVCGEGGGEWAGGCDDPGRVMHECKGDPIQCAIAEQTLRTRCALAASDEVVEAFKSMVEFDGTGEGEGLDRKEISVPETLDVAEIGGGVGLVDKSYTVMGRTITVPFSAINTYLDIFGAAMMMIAWIVAFNTIRGAI